MKELVRHIQEEWKAAKQAAQERCMSMGNHEMARKLAECDMFKGTEDLEGLKIRTAGMLEVAMAYVDCWGAELYPSSFLDVMTPLSAGYYDGQESTLAEADAAGYQTVQTDVTIFPAFYEPAILTMNGDLYESLSTDLREAVDRCAREAMADQRLRNREQEAEILERWQEEDGIAVHVLTEDQWGAFKALTDRIYDPEDPDHQKWFPDCTPEWAAQFRVS